MLKKKWKYSVFDSIRICFIAAPILTSVIFVQMIMSSIVPTLQILATAWFINETVSIVSKGLSVWRALIPIILVVLSIAYQWLIEAVMRLVWLKLQNRLYETYRVAVIEKRARLKYFYIENSDALDTMQRVSEDGDKKIIGILKTLTGVFSLLVRILGILALFLVAVWWAPLLMLIVSIPLLCLAKKSGEGSYKVNQMVTKYERKLKYLGEVLRNRDAVQERTVYQYVDPLNDRWIATQKATGILKLRASLNWYIKVEMGSILTALVSIFGIMVLLQPVLSGALSIGLFISLVNANFGMIEAMSWEMRGYVEQLSKHKGYMGDLKKLVIMDEEHGITEDTTEPRSFNKISFKDIRFKYPNTDKYVLNGVSFDIECGNHYSFVGKNGMGKTTLIKLLVGLYDNYEGGIYIDGTEIRQLEPKVLKSYFSIVYQDFAKYEITLRNNIELGRREELDEGTIQDIIKLVSLDTALDNMPHGLDNYLGRISNGGLDISGGQWQKVAIARCAIGKSPVRILDEPSAALDPVMESRVYEDFSKISQDKTTLFISHRLGSTKLADEILVLDEGVIKQKGSHEQLMQSGGLYCEMFENQRSWYL